MKAELQQIREAVNCGRIVRDTFGWNVGGGPDIFAVAFAALDKLEAQPEQQPTDVPHVHTVYDAVGGGYVCSGCGMRFAAPTNLPAPSVSVDAIMRAVKEHKRWILTSPLDPPFERDIEADLRARLTVLFVL